MKYFGLIWSNLKRRKVVNLLTLFSILTAFLLFGYLAAIRQALSMGIDVAGADRLVVRHSVSIIQNLPVSYTERIARVAGVARVAHATWFGGIYKEPKNFFPQIPVVPEDLLALYPEYLLSDEEVAAWNSTRTGAVVGDTTAERFGWKVGDRVPIQATIWPKRDGSTTWEFDIVGIYEGAEKGVDTTQLFFRYDYFDEARVDFGKGLVGWYIVRVEDPDRATEVAAKIDETFQNSFAETKTETEGAFVQSFAKQVGNIGAIIAAILSAVFFTILLVAGNTMAQTVRERTRELAVLKALGFTHRGVLALVLAESCMLAGLGGGLGLALAWFLIGLGDPTGGALPIFFFPTEDLLLGIVFVLAVGLAAGFFPALRAMRLRIADGMRR